MTVVRRILTAEQADVSQADAEQMEAERTERARRQYLSHYEHRRALPNKRKSLVPLVDL